MDKKRIEIIITGALILIFIFASSLSINKLKQRSQQELRPLPQAEITSLAQTEPSQTEPIYKKEKVQIQEWEGIKWVRCPFSNKIYSGQEGVSDLQLAGIIWDERAPLAIINERIVRVGDNIGVNKITEIKQDRVILTDGAQNFELKLK